jgi:hypothetical protein
MSISNITEEQIFHTLGRGKATDFKPVIVKKAYIQKEEPVKEIIKEKPQLETVKSTDPLPQEMMESVKHLATNMSELTTNINVLQKFMKWIVFPQFIVILVILLALIAKS